MERIAFSLGTDILLRGPLGRGFQYSTRTRRLGVAALGDQLARLLPVIEWGINSGVEVALYCDLPLPPGLPPVVEVHPLPELPNVLPWADELILDLPGDSLETLSDWLGVSPGRSLSCSGQALVEIPMPCGGVAACGACSIRTNRGVSLVCEQGPVVELAQLFR